VQFILGQRTWRRRRFGSSPVHRAAAYGDAIWALPLDLTDRDAVYEAVGRAHRHFGRLDVIGTNHRTRSLHHRVSRSSATAAAILKAVDAAEPPLRLVLGSATIAKFKAVYQARLSNWDKWEANTETAHTE
jgi:NAD(P)-dependent dehydrogenase (short-subunit alcohol dehydrogenase family)